MCFTLQSRFQECRKRVCCSSLNPFRIRSVASLSVIGLAQGEKWTVERVIGHSGEKIRREMERNGEWNV